MQVVAEHLSVEEEEGIKEMFHKMNTTKDRKLTLEQLKTGMHEMGQKISDTDVQILMEAVSISYKHS